MKRDDPWRAASRRFNTWIVCWVLFVAVMLAAAPLEKLTLRNVVPFLALHGALLAGAVYAARGIPSGRRTTGALLLLGFFLLAPVMAVALALADGLTHPLPWLPFTIMGAFFVVTFYTLWAVLRAQSQSG